MYFRLLIISCILAGAYAVEAPPERAVVGGLSMTATWAGPSAISVTFEIAPDGPDMIRLPLVLEEPTVTPFNTHFFSFLQLDTWINSKDRILARPMGRIVSQRNFIKVEKDAHVSLRVNISDEAVGAHSVLKFSNEGTMVQIRYQVEHGRSDTLGLAVGTTGGISRERIPEMWEGVLVCLVVGEVP